MSELIAWGDESVQTQGGVIPTYYMGACICGLGERDIRSQLLSATKRKVSKLHWRDMTLSEKRRSIPVIEALSLPHIVIAATSLDGTVTSERARRKCLELLLPTLEKEYGVSRLVLESRETSQDDRDLVFVRGLRSRRFISRLRVDFAPGFSDARLWIADQALGAIGDTQRGRQDFSSFLKTLDMRELDLHHLA